jgi:hypothetical protein
MLVIVTILVGYVVYFVTLRIVRGAAKAGVHNHRWPRHVAIGTLSFPLLIVFGLLSLKSSVRSDRETTILT